MAAETILVVDDEINTRQGLQTALEQDGYKVITAASGAEAKQILDKTKVQIKRPRKYAVPLKKDEPIETKEKPRKYVTAVQPDRSKSSLDKKP